jgi:hypothetical protein
MLKNLFNFFIFTILLFYFFNLIPLNLHSNFFLIFTIVFKLKFVCLKIKSVLFKEIVKFLLKKINNCFKIQLNYINKR